VTTPPPAGSGTVDNDICARHPESENDEIGMSAPLNESGYKITASAESPVNIKRFICRVVDKIGCKIHDRNALMGFIPFYNGVSSHQTYKHLEYELTTICHAGGMWVVINED
jgi:hypothetical protein